MQIRFTVLVYLPVLWLGVTFPPPPLHLPWKRPFASLRFLVCLCLCQLNNNGYLERLTRTGSKRLDIL